MIQNADVPSKRRRILQAACGAFASCALACSLLPCFSAHDTAFAEDIDTDPAADAFQLEVERTAAAYDEAVSAAEEAGESLAENEQRIAELEALIPSQQARSEAAARELYKFEQQRLSVIELLLDSDSFFEFLSCFDYMNRVTDTYLEEIRQLNQMKAELDEQQTELQQAKADADAHAAEAERALAAAQEARLEAQRKAAEAARQAAEAEAAARAASGNGDSSTQSSADAPSTSEAAAAAEAAVNDTADWSSDEASFISSWAPRIDAYLSGSPMSGMGTAFAQAAWNYGVDPRWSPAIAYTESSLGAYCFLPHNAWGWGSVSWGSWEEAIDAHVRGLARGYGYTISLEAAYKYCPPNAEHWYNVTLAQMNQI